MAKLKQIGLNVYVVNTNKQARMLGFKNVTEAVLAGNVTENRDVINSFAANKIGADISDIKVGKINLATNRVVNDDNVKGTAYKIKKTPLGFAVNNIKFSGTAEYAQKQIEFMREAQEVYKRTGRWITTKDVDYSEEELTEDEEEALSDDFFYKTPEVMP